MTLNRIQYDFAHKRKLYTLTIIDDRGRLVCHDDEIYWNFKIPNPFISKTRLLKMIRIVIAKP